MDLTDFFASRYSTARERFLVAATVAGAQLSHYTHPERHGPDGEELVVDVAQLGDRQASRQLLVISGTHGLEGYAGSASQLAWLKLGALAAPGKLPAGVGVLLVHALNPFGIAYYTRTTENNVDLNRNFIDHAQARPENPDYARLHPHLLAPDWSLDFLDGLETAETKFRDEYGADALFEARVKGQYAHADGLFFGGQGREWSNRTLERIIGEHLSAAERVGLIDWHTGLGDYGQPFFLSFSPEGSAERAQAARWWGSERVDNARPHGLKRPQYAGLVFHGVQQFIGARPLAGAVIEFGTRGIAMNRSQVLDQWLRKQPPEFRRSERFLLLQADLRDAYVPFSQEWRNGVIRQAAAITDQAVAGLAAW